MEEQHSAQVFGLVVGITLIAAGIIGFFYSAQLQHRRRRRA